MFAVVLFEGADAEFQEEVEGAQKSHAPLRSELAKEAHIVSYPYLSLIIRSLYPGWFE